MDSMKLENYIKKTGYYEISGGIVKAVIETVERAFKGYIVIGGERVDELYNIVEPFDFLTHVFLIPKEIFEKNNSIYYYFQNRHKKSKIFTQIGDPGETEFSYDPASLTTEEAILDSCDSKIKIESTLEEKIYDGVIYRDYTCTDKNDAPVKMFALFVDKDKATFTAGTPNNGYESGDLKEKVVDEALDARRDGENIIAAFNADFFDMFGDCMPSGLCVKNSKVVCNGETDRAFFGVTDEGEPVISSFAREPELKGHIRDAVGGMQIMLFDGKILNVDPGEPFGNVRHPRTAVGITKDKKVIVLVVDGRRPEYSNGATLYDLALILKELGADKAINLDGGGSSTFLTYDGEKFVMRNVPSDLLRPTEPLIRDIFNSLLVRAL